VWTDAAGSRVEEEKHGRRRPVRDTVVSHCLNAGGASARAAAAAMAYSDDDDDVTPSAFATYSVPGRPWISCTTNFTPAPMASQFTEPSHGPSFWPVAATTTRRTQQQQQQQRSNVNDQPSTSNKISLFWVKVKTDRIRNERDSWTSMRDGRILNCTLVSVV
jgi:hypothetical protein